MHWVSSLKLVPLGLMLILAGNAWSAPTQVGADNLRRELLIAALHPTPGRVDKAAIAVAAMSGGSYSIAAPLLGMSVSTGPTTVFTGITGTITSAQMIDPYVPVDAAMNVTGTIVASSTITGTAFLGAAGGTITLEAPASNNANMTANAGNGIAVRAMHAARVDVYDNVLGAILASVAITSGELLSGLGTGNRNLVFAGGTLSVLTTAVANVGAGPDTLQTYTLPASSLITTGRGIQVHASGSIANTAAAKTLTCFVGTQAVLTHAMTVSVAGNWDVNFSFTRTGSSAQDWDAVYTGATGTSGAFEYDQERGTATQTETSTMAVYCEATTVTNDNDIIQELQVTKGF